MNIDALLTVRAASFEHVSGELSSPSVPWHCLVPHLQKRSLEQSIKELPNSPRDAPQEIVRELLRFERKCSSLSSRFSNLSFYTIFLIDSHENQMIIPIFQSVENKKSRFFLSKSLWLHSKLTVGV